MKAKISFYSYPIIEYTPDDICKDDKDAIYGQIVFYDKILINKKQPDASKYHTLLHEIIHGILNHANLQEVIPESMREDFVDGLAANLLLFLRENKKLVNDIIEFNIKWKTKGVKNGKTKRRLNRVNNRGKGKRGNVGRNCQGNRDKS